MLSLARSNVGGWYQRPTCSTGVAAVGLADTALKSRSKPHISTVAIRRCSNGRSRCGRTSRRPPPAEHHPAQLDARSGFEATSADTGTSVKSVINGEFKDGVLTSYARGRGLGDCDSRQSFVWDATRFRLSEQADMGECRGNIDYITTWRAKVIR